VQLAAQDPREESQVVVTQLCTHWTAFGLYESIEGIQCFRVARRTKVLKRGASFQGTLLKRFISIVSALLLLHPLHLAGFACLLEVNQLAESATNI